MLWEAITQIGSLHFFLSVIALFFAFGRRRIAVGLSYLFLIDALLVLFLKGFFKTPRPSLHTETTYSFPSGHSSRTAALVSFLVEKKTVYLLFLPVLVGMSRIFLNEHYPIDVLCGIALGLGEGFLLRKIWHGFFERYKKAEKTYKETWLLILAILFPITLSLAFYGIAYADYAGALLGLFFGIFLYEEVKPEINFQRLAIALAGFVFLVPNLFAVSFIVGYLTHFLFGLWVSFLSLKVIRYLGV